MNIHKRYTLGSRTLEYFVVFTVVLMLSVFAFTQLSEARVDARDATRVSDMHTMRKVLEFYRTEHGSYPAVGWANSADPESWGALEEELEEFIAMLPVDIRNETTGVVHKEGSFNYSYYSEDGNNYFLFVRFEDVEGVRRYVFDKAWQENDGKGFSRYPEAVAPGVHVIRAPR